MRPVSQKWVADEFLRVSVWIISNKDDDDDDKMKSYLNLLKAQFEDYESIYGPVKIVYHFVAIGAKFSVGTLRTKDANNILVGSLLAHVYMCSVNWLHVQCI